MAEPFSAPSFFNMDFDSYVKGQMLMAWNALPTKYRLLHDGELYYLAALGMLILVICCFSKGHRTTYSRTYCCCLRRDTSTVVERLDGSTYLFLCANPFHNPLLWTVGVLSSTLQLILLIIVVVRVDANYQARSRRHARAQPRRSCVTAQPRTCAGRLRVQLDALPTNVSEGHQSHRGHAHRHVDQHRWLCVARHRADARLSVRHEQMPQCELLATPA